MGKMGWVRNSKNSNYIEMFCSRVIEVTLILPATSVSMNADIASSYSPVPEWRIPADI